MPALKRPRLPSDPDAVNIGLAEEYETNAILTLGRRDFSAFAPLTGWSGFRILPDDL